MEVVRIETIKKIRALTNTFVIYFTFTFIVNINGIIHFFLFILSNSLSLLKLGLFKTEFLYLFTIKIPYFV